jgi:hypothetical protein
MLVSKHGGSMVEVLPSQVRLQMIKQKRLEFLLFWIGIVQFIMKSLQKKQELRTI